MIQLRKFFWTLLTLVLCLISSAGLVYANEAYIEGPKEISITTIDEGSDLFAGYVDQVLGDSLFSQDETLEQTETADSSNKEEAALQSLQIEVSTDQAADATTNRGSKLTGQNAILYKYMKSAVLSIAAGTKTNTQIKIPTTELLGTRTISEKKLGTTIYNESTGNWGDGSKIGTKAYGLFTFSTSQVLDALLQDCPYELYWYEKTVGSLTEKPSVLEIRKTNGGELYFGKYVTITMTVSKDYRDASNLNYASYGGSRFYYNTDATRTGAATQVVATADAVVRACADATDYDKLVYYRDYICEQVSYNFEAADTTYSDGYGDPWQLIYVFDEDASTDVVCEGYSKAFQYLCDLTDWDNSAIVCYSINGDFSSPGSYGAHMWNIVHMPDGYNYLVDLTNLDGKEADAGLFMAGYWSGSVTWGYNYRSSSQLLTYEYGEDVLTLFSTKELTMSDHDYPCPNGHVIASYGYQWATIEVNGKSDGFYCSECGEVFVKRKTIYRPASVTVGSLTYNGYNRIPKVTVYDSKGNVISSEYYTIEYPTAKNVGTYQLEIYFNGDPDGENEEEGYWSEDENGEPVWTEITVPSEAERFEACPYSGSITVSYTIKPRSTTISKLVAGSKKITVYWKKQSPQVSGYQIKRATNSSFTKNVKTITCSGYSTTKKALTNLKAKTRYYVKIRTYKWSGGKKYYSSWSAKKYITTR